MTRFDLTFLNILNRVIVFVIILALMVFAEGTVVNVFAADEAASAGASAGAATSAGISSGTIAVGVLIAAAAVAVIASGGGGGQEGSCCGPVPGPPTYIDPPPSIDKETRAALINLMTTLTIEQLINFQIVVVGMTTEEFLEFQAALADISSVNELAGLASISKLQKFLDKLNSKPAVKAALIALLKSLDQKQLDALKAFVSSLSSKEFAAFKAYFATIHDMKDAVKALLAALHPGMVVTFVTTHHGGNVYSTTFHMKPK